MSYAKRFSEMNNAPKKSWLYNAMNLYYENHYEIGLFHAHGKDIVATNQLALLTVEDEKIQEELIVEVAENKISTRVLKERIKSFSEGSLTNTKKYRKSLKSIKTMLRNKKTHLEGTAKQVQTLKSKLSAWEKEIEGLLEESK